MRYVQDRVGADRSGARCAPDSKWILDRLRRAGTAAEPAHGLGRDEEAPEPDIGAELVRLARVAAAVHMGMTTGAGPGGQGLTRGAQRGIEP